MPPADGVNYDLTAGDYAAHRRIHAGVFCELCERLGSAPLGSAPLGSARDRRDRRHRRGQVGPDSTVLEVGCGTGNYISALAGHTGCAACGLDPAAGMLAHARTRPERVAWLLSRAEQLGFADEAFALIFSVDVIHHVADKAAYYREAARVLRRGGLVCTVTDSEEIIRRREVLSGYFPETVEIELVRYARLAQLEGWMAAAGLVDLAVVTVEQPYEVTSAEPFRTKAYSSLHLISEEAWRAGLERLERDLACGPIRGVSRYACVWGRKPGE